jgi:hypothetical protein
MSSPQGRKPKTESYEYSWFLPAGGKISVAVVSQLPPSEADVTEEAGENSEIAAMQARTEQWRRSGDHRSAQHEIGFRDLDSTRIRVIGLAGWSAVAGSGAILMASRLGQYPSTQLGILAGVWIGISAAIWFVPAILSRGKKP